MSHAALQITVVPLSAEHVPLCGRLWGDRLLAREPGFDDTLASVTTLLAAGLARGALLLDQDRRPRYFGLTAFVAESFTEHFRRAPHPRVGALILKKHLAGSKGLILDEAAIARGNAGAGLHMVVLGQGWDMEGAPADSWGTLFGSVVTTFIDSHRGFNLAHIIGETFGEDGVEIIRTSNAFTTHQVFKSTSRTGEDLRSIVFAMSREEALRQWSPFVPMFTYEPPRMALTGPERRLLREALSTGTDEAVATRLGITRTAVKARWTRILRRVSQLMPDIPLADRPANGAARGAQKRHLVLDFVRAHPSELTPYQAPRRAAAS